MKYKEVDWGQDGRTGESKGGEEKERKRTAEGAAMAYETMSAMQR